MSPMQYAAEMRQIEERRNAACRQGDRVAIEAVLARVASLNERFFRRNRS